MTAILKATLLSPIWKVCQPSLPAQGHALFTRAAGSTIPCPAIDFVGGFNQFLAAAYGLPEGTTIEEEYGAAFDPFMNDQNYVLCVLTLEELGATGNLGLSQIALNPVIAGGIGGLATSATAQATVERMMLWGLRNETIAPFNETTQQVFARVSALRDSLDGPQVCSLAHHALWSVHGCAVTICWLNWWAATIGMTNNISIHALVVVCMSAVLCFCSAFVAYADNHLHGCTARVTSPLVTSWLPVPPDLSQYSTVLTCCLSCSLMTRAWSIPTPGPLQSPATASTWCPPTCTASPLPAPPR